MNLIALYLTSAPEIPKPAQKCDKCVTPHIIQVVGPKTNITYI